MSLGEFLNIFPDSACLLDSAGLVVQSNTTFESTMGTAQSLPNAIIHEKDRDRFLLALRNAFNCNSNIAVGECDSLSLDGVYLSIDWLLKFAADHHAVIATGRIVLTSARVNVNKLTNVMFPLLKCVDFALNDAFDHVKNDWPNVGKPALCCKNLLTNLIVNEQLKEVLHSLAVDVCLSQGGDVSGNVLLDVNVNTSSFIEECEDYDIQREVQQLNMDDLDGGAGNRLWTSFCFSFVRKMGSSTGLSSSQSSATKRLSESELRDIGEVIDKHLLGGKLLSSSSGILYKFSIPTTISRDSGVALLPFIPRIFSSRTKFSSSSSSSADNSAKQRGRSNSTFDSTSDKLPAVASPPTGLVSKSHDQSPFLGMTFMGKKT